MGRKVECPLCFLIICLSFRVVHSVVSLLCERDPRLCCTAVAVTVGGCGWNAQPARPSRPQAVGVSILRPDAWTYSSGLTKPEGVRLRPPRPRGQLSSEQMTVKPGNQVPAAIPFTRCKN